MSTNSDWYYAFRRKLEDTKKNLGRYKTIDPSFIYNVQELQEVADEILKSLAAEWLSNDLYYEEYPEEEEEKVTDDDDDENCWIEYRSD